MSGITYGQWWARMSAQVANDNASAYYDAQRRRVEAETEKVEAETEKLKLEKAKLEAEIEQMRRASK